jgi:hypothetical protein
VSAARSGTSSSPAPTSWPISAEQLGDECSRAARGESLPSELDQVRGALDLLAHREPSDPDPDRRLRFFLCLVLPRRRERSLTSVLAGTPTAQTGEHSRDHSKQRPAYRTAVPAQRLIAQLVSKQFFDPGPKSLSFAD